MLSLSFSLFLGASTALCDAALAQAMPAGFEVAQSRTPATTVRVVNKDTLLVKISEGSFRFDGALIRRVDQKFNGQNAAGTVRVMFDRATGRMVVINARNGEELFNYFVRSADSSSGGAAANPLQRAKDNCLTAVARQVGVPRSKVKVILAQSAQSGISVNVKVPEATAPWFCFADRQGTVKEVRFKGSEGAL